jgi:hypothetical protein
MEYIIVNLNQLILPNIQIRQDYYLGLTIAKRALLGHYCHIFTFVVGLEQCKNMGRQPNYEPFIVPVAAIPVIF